MPEKVAAAAIGNGLPESSLGKLLVDLMNGNATALADIPGVTPAITEASISALKQAYLDSFHAVWYAACPFAAIGVIGKL